MSKYEAGPTQPQHVVALSGGKDSTALALRLRELHPEIPFQFVCTPTGDELPEMAEHWYRLHQLLGGIRMLQTKTLEQIIQEQQMIPNFRARFCTRILKLEPFFKFMESLPPGSVTYVGLRADEPDRIGAMLDPDDTFQIKYPFREWGWGLKEVQDYLTCRGIEIPARTDCGACFYQRLGEWKTLWEKYPERYDRYARLERDIGYPFRSPWRDTWPAFLDELREEFKRGRKIRQTKKRDEGFTACPWCAK